MHVSAAMIRAPLSVAVALCTALSAGAAAADAVDACVAGKQRQAREMRTFRAEGGVTCPSAELVGFPPRERRHDRDAVVRYAAPEGWKIVNENVGSVTVRTISSNGGAHGDVTVARGDRSLSVRISCRGKGLTQGRAWQKIEVQGRIRREPTRDDLKTWIRACVLAEARRR